MRAARYMGSALALDGLGVAAALTRLLPERDPHPALYERLTVLAEHLDNADLGPALVVRFELAVLAELGFGLDLDTCAATGRTDDLVFVSPRSGRAVSAEAGAPYRDRLFALPAFLGRGFDAAPPSRADVLAGFALTGYFLSRHVFEPRGVVPPLGRARIVEHLRRQG